MFIKINFIFHYVVKLTTNQHGILYTCTLANTYIQYTQCNLASAYAMLAMHARS